MGFPQETISMAMFCDFENVALGVRDAKYEKFDIEPVLERLLLKGSIVLKKAYCDWDRYKAFKATMHEANFELIEIPHLRQSGKNSADIRMVVDALDLCYTKAHVNTFVIVSGDSDFSPLVSKLRENAKYVIGVGVKQSTSDLLIANCDEFIFYDDLVRETQRKAAKREQKAAARPAADNADNQKTKAIETLVETLDALVNERGDSGKIWASMLKSAIIRRKPHFNESYYGFKSFGNLLEEAQACGLIEVGKDEKSGAFVTRVNGNSPQKESVANTEAVVPVVEEAPVCVAETVTTEAPPVIEAPTPPVIEAVVETAAAEAAVKVKTKAKPAKPRTSAGKKRTPKAAKEPEMTVKPPEPEPVAAEVVAEPAPSAPAVTEESAPKAAPKKKPSRPRKPKAASRNADALSSAADGSSSASPAIVPPAGEGS